MKGIVHSGITVRDLAVSIPFYRDVLGLTLVKEEPARASRGEKLGVPGAIVKIAVFNVPGSDASIELIQYMSPPSPNTYGAPVNALGHVHIAFRVRDIAEKMARLKQHNVAFTNENYETITDGPLAGWKWIYFKDPDGTNLELIEESENC